MSAWVRCLLVWIMVLALPVQGHAIAVMQHCVPGSGGARGIATAPPAVGTADWPAHESHGHGPTAHHPASRQDAVAHHPASPPDTGAQHAASRQDTAADAPAHHHPAGGERHDAQPSGHGCSVCAACCAAIGFPAPALQAPAAGAASAPPRSAAASPPTFLTAGPERPPRHVLA